MMIKFYLIFYSDNANPITVRELKYTHSNYPITEIRRGISSPNLLKIINGRAISML